MTAPAHIAEPTRHPDPHPGQATAAASTRTSRLLGLVRKLIAFGSELADKLKRNPSPETIRWEATRFGTLNLALILARITRGLQLAAALEAKLALRADRPDPVRATTPRATSPRKPRSPRQKDPHPDLPDLPTAEQIAEHLRSRPLRAVLVELCSDLGIVPADPLWQEVVFAVMDYGGGILPLWKDAMKRTAISNFVSSNVRLVWPKLPQTWELPLPPVAVASTGPP